ncbi:MAG: hypothetical protein ACLFQP_08545 [Halothece sp.]
MDIISSAKRNPIQWSVVVFVTLCFWLSASMVLDFVIIPSLMQAGMMTEPGFISAGYSMFGLFNHIELLCAGFILSGFLVLKRNQILPPEKGQWAIIFATFLLGIAVICRYFLTPQLSGLGIDLNWFEANTMMSAEMMKFHLGYWFLELTKFIVGGLLLVWSFQAWKPETSH